MVQEKTQKIKELQHAYERLDQLLLSLVEGYQQRLEEIHTHPVMSQSMQLLWAQTMQLDEIKQNIDKAMMRCLHTAELRLQTHKENLAHRHPLTQITQYQKTLDRLSQSLDHSLMRTIERHKEHLRFISQSFKQIDPKNLLKKGYSILFAKNSEQVLSSIDDLTLGREIHALMSDGEIPFTVGPPNKP